MKVKRLSSGSDVIDSLLEGGYEQGVLSTIYGPAGSGKTTMAMLCAISAAKSGKKTIFIDTEGGFSAERFMQLAEGDKELLKSILVMKPGTFQEQMKTLSNLTKNINERIGLVVIDTISMLYRAEVSRTKDVKNVNNDLGLQISWLTDAAISYKIPVITTNQVYADFEDKCNVKMVGGDILRYSSKCLVELQNFRNARKAIIKKHRSLPENKEAVFEIVEKGFEKKEVEEV